MASGDLGLIVVDQFPNLPLQITEDRARLVDAGSQIQNCVFLELIFVFFTTVITDGLMLREAEPVGLTVVWLAFNRWMVRTRVNNEVCISNEKVFLLWES